MSDTLNKDLEKQFAEILGPTDPVVDAQARERLITARIGLLLKQPFFGNLATRLKLTNADEWCPTAATDGRKFYYNSRFIMMLEDEKECEFLFGHEVLHCIYQHIGRRVDNDHEAQLSNIAADYCVNGDLIQHKIGKMITTVPCLHEPKYYGWSYEKVYKDLYDNAEKIDISELLEQLLDEHLEHEQSTGTASKEGDTDQKGNGDNPKKPKLTEKEKNEIKDELQEALVTAVKNSTAGDLPQGVKRIIQDITEPKMNWRELIHTSIQSLIKNDYSFIKPNRKGWDQDAVLPGMKNDEMIHVAIFLDLSGSITDQAKDFLGETIGIMEEFQQFQVHLATFDTEVYNYKIFTNDNFDEIREYELRGGGGTDFECIFKHMKEELIEPEKLIVFTDGYPWNSWGDPLYADTLWVIHGDSNPNPPFGQFVLYDS